MLTGIVTLLALMSTFLFPLGSFLPEERILTTVFRLSSLSIPFREFQPFKQKQNYSVTECFLFPLGSFAQA